MAATIRNKINARAFRDPSTAWLGPDKKWRLIVGSRRNKRGLAILYKSGDFLQWIKAKHPLHSAPKSGMWECPDFFPVSVNSRVGLETSTADFNVKYIFKVSLDDTKKDYYTIGTYNHDKDVYVPDHGSIESDSGLRYDYGKFYASKTFYDSGKHRRILWGWVNESTLPRDVSKGWSGLQAVPRTLWLDKKGKQLIQWPIEELKSLRDKQVKLARTVLEGGTIQEIVGVTAAQADVVVTFAISDFDFEKIEVLDQRYMDPQTLCSKKDATVNGSLGPFGLLALASEDLQEYTAIFYRVFRSHNYTFVVHMCTDLSAQVVIYTSSLNGNIDKASYGAFVTTDPRHEKLSLRTLIDHSIVESFAGEGKACITARVYPRLAVKSDAHLYAFNYGNVSLKIAGNAWTLKSARIN